MSLPEDPSAPTDALEAAWIRLRDQWDDEDAHRKYIALASSTGRLPDAGRRYRQARDKAATPAERAVAEAQLARIVATAMTVMEGERTPPVGKNHSILWIAFALMMVMMATAAYVLTATRSSNPTPSQAGHESADEP